MQKTESHLAHTSHMSCSSLGWMVSGGSKLPRLNHPEVLPSLMTLLKASRCGSDPQIARTATQATAIGSDAPASLLDEEETSACSTPPDAARITYPEQRSIMCAKHMTLRSCASKQILQSASFFASHSIMVILFDALSIVKCPSLSE